MIIRFNWSNASELGLLGRHASMFISV